MFRVLRPASPLGILSHGWLQARYEVCLCPGSNLGYNVSLWLERKHVTHRNTTWPDSISYHEGPNCCQAHDGLSATSDSCECGKIRALFEMKVDPVAFCRMQTETSRRTWTSQILIYTARHGPALFIGKQICVASRQRTAIAYRLLV